MNLWVGGGCVWVARGCVLVGGMGTSDGSMHVGTCICECMCACVCDFRWVCVHARTRAWVGGVSSGDRTKCESVNLSCESVL